MTDLQPRTKAYNERMVEHAERLRRDPDERQRVAQLLMGDAQSQHEDGIFWRDVWNYIYGAMSESLPAQGGLLVPADYEGAVNFPLRGGTAL